MDISEIVKRLRDLSVEAAFGEVTKLQLSDKLDKLADRITEEEAINA